MKNFIRTLTSAKTIGIDTMVFIYLLEGQKTYLPLVRLIFDLKETGKIMIISSFISYLETLSSPRLDDKRLDLYSKFFLKSKNLILKPVDQEVSDYAAFLRRTYHLRTPDAIQIGTAIINKTNLFISNDATFKKVKEIKNIVLKDFV